MCFYSEKKSYKGKIVWRTDLQLPAFQTFYSHFLFEIFYWNESERFEIIAAMHFRMQFRCSANLHTGANSRSKYLVFYRLFLSLVNRYGEPILIKGTFAHSTRAPGSTTGSTGNDLLTLAHFYFQIFPTCKQSASLKCRFTAKSLLLILIPLGTRSFIDYSSQSHEKRDAIKNTSIPSSFGATRFLNVRCKACTADCKITTLRHTGHNRIHFSAR